MSIYRLTDEAIKDLEEIYIYLYDFGVDTANKFLDTFEQKCETLTQFPKLGKSYEELEPQLRGTPIDGHIIFYRLVNSDIEVIRVVSGRRNLGNIFS